MISDYITTTRRRSQMRASCVGPYIDSFAGALADAGYSPCTIRGYLRAADHLGRWADRRKVGITDFDDYTIDRFRKHLSACRCAGPNKGIFRHALWGALLLLTHLRKLLVVAPRQSLDAPRIAPN